MKQVSLLLATFFLAVLPATAQQFTNGQPADVVLGQSDFTTTSAANFPNRFSQPESVTRDPITGKVFVGDSGHYRILRYSSMAAATSGAAPEAVLGQPNFNSYASNQGGAAGANTLHFFYQIMFDHKGRLWVADRINNRVLCWFAASTLANNSPADFVFGQPNFTTTIAGTTQAKCASPSGVWVDTADTLWIGDEGNNRVLRFDDVSSKPSGALADGVLGQGNFATFAAGTTATSMDGPYSVSVDASGRLWVADTFNNRVLRFDAAATKANGAAADGVLGQPNFTSSASALSAAGLGDPYGVLAVGNTVWVGDYGQNRVLGFANAAALPNGGAASTVLGQPDFVTVVLVPASGILGGPVNLCPGPADSLLVADYNFNRVLRFSPSTAEADAANAALKAQLLSKAKKLKKKAKAAKADGKIALAKKLTAKAKKLIEQANAL